MMGRVLAESTRGQLVTIRKHRTCNYSSINNVDQFYVIFASEYMFPRVIGIYLRSFMWGCVFVCVGLYINLHISQLTHRIYLSHNIIGAGGNVHWLWREPSHFYGKTNSKPLVGMSSIYSTHVKNFSSVSIRNGNS